MIDVAGCDGRGIVVLPLARTVMRALRPAVWPVLLDVARDAEWRDGRLVDATSARLVAEHLGIAASTAAARLRSLCEHGFVELAQASGANGRFGLAIYNLHLPDGIDVCSPHTVKPDTEKPHTEKPLAETAADASFSSSRGEAKFRNTDARSKPGFSPLRRRRRSSVIVEQGAFDLETDA